MATPAIRSLNTGAGDAGTTCTVTKPSGTAENDLLVALVFTYEGTGAKVPSDEAGWTTIDSDSQGFQAVKAYWKIAGGSEPASYTFDTGGTTDSIRAIVFAITGHYASAPIGDFETPKLATSTATPSLTTSLFPRRSDALLIMGIISDASTSSMTTSGYTISGTNPTWTERYDNTESSDHILGVATATANSSIEITTMGVTYSAVASNHLGVFLAIPEQAAVEVTLDTVNLSLTPETLSPTGKATITLDTVDLTLTPETLTASEIASDWVNTDKSADPSFVNIPKT